MRRPCLAPVLALAACARPSDRLVLQADIVWIEEAPDKLLARGRAFAAMSDHARAEQYFAAALAHGADPHVALPLLFRACAEEQRYRAAIDYAEPILRKHPADYHLRFVVASFYKTIGEIAAARAELERVAHDQPDFAPAHFALGILFRDDLGDVGSADAAFRAYLRIEPHGAHAEEAHGSLLKRLDPGAAVPSSRGWHDVRSQSRQGYP